MGAHYGQGKAICRWLFRLDQADEMQSRRHCCGVLALILRPKPRRGGHVRNLDTRTTARRHDARKMYETEDEGRCDQPYSPYPSLVDVAWRLVDFSH